MRVLFLAHRLPYPPNKGDKIRSFWELRHLAANHEVDLFCFYDDDGDARFIEPAREFCTNLYAERLSWWRSRWQSSLALLRGQAFSPAYFYSATMAHRVKQAIRTRDYDLIFVYCSSMAQYASAPGIPRVIDLVDADSDKWAQYVDKKSSAIAWLYRLEARRLAELEGQIVRDYSATLVTTAAEAAILNRKGPSSNVVVLENHLNVDYFDPNKVELTKDIIRWQPYVIFTGQMDYLPNIDAVTFFHREVFRRLKEAVPNIHFVIAGRNPTREVTDLAKDTSVFVTGATPDMRPFLKGAVAAIAPMRIARGVQNKILEALAMGVPVAASRKAASALPQALLSHLVVEDDPERFGDALVELCRQPTKKLSPEVHKVLTERFNEELLAGQFESIVRAATERSNSLDSHTTAARYTDSHSVPGIVSGQGG